MADEKRDFKGIWIPAEIWLSRDLSVMEKLFLLEIDSLDNDQGCFASNAHFADFFDISKGRCSQIIKSLEAKKLIKISLTRKGKQIIKRTIKVVNKLNRGSEKIKGGYLENDEGSNTLLSNTKPFSDLINQILESWKKHLPNNPQPIAKNFTGSSKYKTLITRIKSDEQHQAIEFWDWYFSKLAENPFNLGHNDRGWKANLDYAITKSKFENNIERFASE